MKITIRLIISLVLMVAVVAVGFTFYQVNSEKKTLMSDIERRSAVLAESLHETITLLVTSNSNAKLARLVKQFGNRERLKGVAILDVSGGVMASTPGLEPAVLANIPEIVKVVTEKSKADGLTILNDKETYVYSIPLSSDDKAIGTLVLLQDVSFINTRLKDIWRYNILRVLILSAFITVITLFVVRWSIEGPIALLAEWIKEIRSDKGRNNLSEKLPKGTMLEPLISEVTHMANSLALARARAEEEASLRLKSESLWTASRLKEYIGRELGGKKLFLISNREPYMDMKEGRSIKTIVPAGGLVTALDPVMRICDGLWLAHGSGDADRETVDNDDKLRVPPEEPAYTLKRVWLTKEDEDGYYYGFSNEGLWPLCHITHTRPLFRLEDWIAYQRVNEKFAVTLLKEIEHEEAPLILIQDYHLALLPLLIKKRRPDAKVAIFWHIPWPNPESYGICPWRQELLLGMLGADLIGFHIQVHCNNFLDTVDSFLESKSDWAQFKVVRGGHSTLVRPFPISVAFDNADKKIEFEPEKNSAMESVLKDLGIHAEYLGVGVDRIDYTKGIAERFMAIARFFEKHPEFIGRFTFVELGAPSRTHIKRYHDLIAELDELSDKINWRYKTKTWKPIAFLKAHHGHKTIMNHYKGADLCIVSSLHDGMNLVAKEFVASRDDNDGVLILSQFAGAARELSDAIIVNPYDIEVMADAIYHALTMSPEERATRMEKMRAIVRENNIYRWAGNLITDLARLRIEDNG